MLHWLFINGESHHTLRAALAGIVAFGACLLLGPRVIAWLRAKKVGERIEKDEVTLSHGPIPALQWPAMTMGFRSPPAGVPPDVKSGDAVIFDFVERDGSYALTRIERQGARR